MIQTVKVLKGLSSVPQWEGGIKEICLEHIPISSGGFGEIYTVLSVQGQPFYDIVCKIFYSNSLSYKNFKSVQTLQMHYQKVNKKQEWTNIETLPLFSFEGILQDKPVYGYLMRYLSEKEYANFSVFMEDKHSVQAYYDLDLEHKLGYAKSFISQIYGLQQLSFIHADISADNIFIHLESPKVALVDFDSGVIAEGNAKPTTWGKPNEWVEPQIMFDLARQRTKKMPVISVSLLSDVWSAHIGLHYLMFMVHPFFFMHTLSEKNLRLYFKHYTWPDAYQEKGQDLFLPDAQVKYEKYIRLLYDSIPRDIFSCFQQTFNEGFFNPDKRTDIGVWVNVLRDYGNRKDNNFALPCPVVVKKTDYPALKAPKLRPVYKKKSYFQPQRKSFYPKYHQKTSFLPLSHISSVRKRPYTGNTITTGQVIRLILVNLAIILMVFGGIQIWESAHKNKWIEKFRNIQPIEYDTIGLQSKNNALRKEYETYKNFEKAAENLQSAVQGLKNLSDAEIENLYQNSTQMLVKIQNRDDSLFKVMLSYKGKPDSLYVAYQKWLRSYNTLVTYQKGVESLKKVIQKTDELMR